MRRFRGRLVAASVASVVLFLQPVGHAAGSASDPPSHSLRASKGSPAQVKTPKAYSRQVPRRLNSPEGILLKDLKSGRILLENQADRPMAPASLPKIKAATLGLTRTHFQNACGFDMPDHYSTAEDLAALTTYAMGNETFAAIVREPAAVIRTADQRKRFIARTTNRLLGTMDGVVGVKTGYTREAGRCLIAVVTREDKELLLVLLNARQRWGRAQELIELGLQASEESAQATSEESTGATAP